MQQQIQRPIFSIFDILDRVLDKGIIISAGEQAQSSRHEVERMVTGTRGRLGFSKLFRKCFSELLCPCLVWNHSSKWGLAFRQRLHNNSLRTQSAWVIPHLWAFINPASKVVKLLSKKASTLWVRGAPQAVYSNSVKVMHLVSQKVLGGNAFTKLLGLFHPPKA